MLFGNKERNDATIYPQDNTRQIRVGAEFPPKQHRARLAEYRVFKKLYENKKHRVFERAQKILRDSQHEPQLEALRIAVNLAELVVTKPADMLVGEPPQYESGLPDDSAEQQALTSIVEENDLNLLTYEAAIGAGIRGDAFIQTRYDTRQDYSALAEMGVTPENNRIEPIIEHVAAELVFPELSVGSAKKFRAIDIAQVHYVDEGKKETPYLDVTRHMPGYIAYERYRLSEFEGGVDRQNEYDYPIQIYKNEELISREVVATGTETMLVQHIAYKSADYTWRGTSVFKSLLPLINGINDRIMQIDYILWKHSDPTMYGPPVENLRGGGMYIPVTPEDTTPGYLTWNSQLDAAFKELELLIGLVFQIAETPQWLFGTVLGDQNAGGTGTSHTDSAAIKARFMPILSKVARVRTQFDRALRDALYNCQLLDIAHGGAQYEAIYPTINWSDGLPRNEKEEAEIAEIRIASRVLDRHSAVKRLDRVDDEKARETLRRIDGEEETVDASIFNGGDES